MRFPKGFKTFPEFWRHQHNVPWGDPTAGYVAFDTFTRADSNSSLGTASDKGGTWTVLQGTPGITGGKAYAVVADMRATLGSMPNGNGTLQCTLSSANWTTDPADLLLRVTDTNNYIGFLITGPSVASIRSRIAGVLTTLQSFTPTLVNGNSAVFKLVLNGTSISVFQNGVQLGTTFTLTGGAAAINGTAAGIWSSTAQLTTTFDNYSVLP